MKKTKERKLTKSIIAVVMSAVFIVCSISTAVFAVNGDDDSSSQSGTSDSSSVSNESNSSDPSNDNSSNKSDESSSNSTSATTQQPSTTPTTSNSAAVGTKFTSGNYMYMVTGKNTVALKGFAKNVSLSTVKVKSNVTFNGVTYKVTKIGKASFKGENSIKTVISSLSVTSIGKHAFLKCKNLKKVRIKSNVTVIGQSAFRYCSKLSTINITSVVLKDVHQNAFSNIKSGAVINVMDASTRTLIKPTLKTKVSINVM